MTATDLPDIRFVEEIARDGYAVLLEVVTAAELERLREALSDAMSTLGERRRGGDRYAVRNLLRDVPAVRELAHSPTLSAIAEAVLGPEARPVRGILFDKPPAANWAVPWHQDVTIAVRERVDLSGWGPWTTKAGVLHVQPPASVLEQMLAIRLHLDACGEENGPLLVLPGSHAEGRLDTEAIAGWKTRVQRVSCTGPAGSAVLMRPLLLHASASATAPAHRRVVHLEYAAGPLPPPLSWADC
jgi:ectoine hydroxylase-related dioxygenase (phytanoyl-CoA dioxygenase family)